MKEMYSVSYVISILEVLAENPYNGIWSLVEDIRINGHTISVKRSNQLRQVVIDGVYQHIGGNITINREGVTYKPLEYVEKLLKNEF